MAARNGWTKIVIGIFTALSLALAGWSGRTLISHGERITSAEAHQENLREWLERVEEKLDRALGR